LVEELHRYSLEQSASIHPDCSLIYHLLMRAERPRYNDYLLVSALGTSYLNTNVSNTECTYSIFAIASF